MLKKGILLNFASFYITASFCIIGLLHHELLCITASNLHQDYFMAFGSLAPFIDLIEKGFGDKKSPRTIARELGQPGLYSTINRYKAAVWDLRDLVDEAKEVRAQRHDDARDKAKDEIVNTLDVVNLGKLRAKQLLDVNLGDLFAVSDGTMHALTLGSASVYWPIGSRMLFECAKLELELSGDDAESRLALAMESWEETRLAIMKAVEDDPKSKEKIIAALEQERRSDLCSRSGHLDKRGSRD
jgi:hypothetical protein